MCYDPIRERVVLFGGVGGGDHHGDTWEWDGSSWELVASSGPSPRGGHFMTFDEARGVAVLFGGEDGTGELGDTWTWDGVEWSLAATDGPAARFDGDMAYDRARERVTLFGGRIGNAFAPADTWEWDGSSWTLAASSGPSPRFLNRLTYDSLERRVVLFGGRSGAGDESDLWSWTGSTWETQAQVDTPTARWGHALAFDDASHALLLFGGACGATGDCPLFEDTWTKTRAFWHSEAGSGPSPRTSHAMVYDAARRQIVLFGGGDSTGTRLGDTWIWSPRRADRLYALGQNVFGRLGIGTSESPDTPTPVVGLDAVVELDTGENFTIARRADGAVWLWGRFDGTDQHDSPVPLHFDRIAGAVEIGAGWDHQLAVVEGGQAVAMGRNDSGELGDGSTSDRFLDPRPMLGITQAIAVDSNGLMRADSFVLGRDGTVWACGFNGENGLLGRGFVDPDAQGCPRYCYPTLQPVVNLSDIVALAAGLRHCVTARADGTVWGWGNGWNGQLGNGANGISPVPVQAVGIDDAIAIAAGGDYTLILRATGEVWAMGANGCGQLGNGTFTNDGRYNTPEPVLGLSEVVAIACGFNHSLAVRRDGSVWAWGGNRSGQLGYETSGDCSPDATPMPGVSRALFVAGGIECTFIGIADRSPDVAEQPLSQNICRAGDAELSVTVFGGAQQYAWHKDGTPLTDGPTGTGSTIDGSASDHLVISNVSSADSGDYTCLVSNSCGEAVSDTAHLFVCLADFNCDGPVNTLDVLAFLNAWTAGDSSADINGDGSINTQDVLAFLNAWTAGC